jgi:hypothetical protein
VAGVFGGQPRSSLLFVIILFVKDSWLGAPAATRLDINGRPLGVLDNGCPLGALGLLLSSGACPPAPAFRPLFAFPLTASQIASPHFLQEDSRFEGCRTNL